MPLMSQSYFSKCPEKGPISTSMCPIHVVTMLLYGSGLSRLSFEDVSEGLVHICLMRYLCCSKNTSLCFPMLTKKKGYPQHHHFHPESFCPGSSFKKKTTILDEDVGQGGITQMWQGLHRSLHAAGCFAEAFRLLPNIHPTGRSGVTPKAGKMHTKKIAKMKHFLKGTEMEIHWN